jgi:glycosyltransferase involved in cell wall biosynthesis
MALTWLSAAVFAASLAIAAEVWRGWHRLGRLRDVPPMLPANRPHVSIVVAARDEARSIEAAMRSILAIDYEALEIVAVDDRSSDGTGEILERLHGEFPRLTVVHVRDLPAGWLGKNHALHTGASNARGRYILFTDADVLFEPSAIARAVAHCEARTLDHLTVLPDVPARDAFVQFFTMGGFVGLLALYRPWRASASAKHHLGVGAFNMVRAEPYRAMGGHEALAMEVLDDIELGRRMGRGHLRQEVLLGFSMVGVEIYHSATEMLRGIQKNVFTFLDYSVAKLLAATLVTFSLNVWPWLGMIVTDGATRWLCAGAAASLTALYLGLAPRFGYSRWCVAWLPLMGLISIALYWQVAIATWLRGGIVWRGTFYPLAEIRRRRRESRRER